MVDFVEGRVEMLTSVRRDSSGQGECISFCRTVMIAVCNYTVFLWHFMVT